MELDDLDRRFAMDRLATLLDDAQQAVIDGDVLAAARAIGGAQYCYGVLAATDQTQAAA